jgi:threonine aldolase
MIDLRSDTVTTPTKKMKDYMVNSPLGDDVYGEDPSINLLQEKTADLFNKEEALFVPSGTMANLISVLTHCDRGEEVLLGNKSHIFYYEAGGVSSFGGIHSHQLNNLDNGTIDISDIKNNIRKKDDDHFPRTKLLCLENTHNFCYGSPIEKNYFKEVKKLLDANNINLHIDGARIFNAAVALKTSVAELTSTADSVSCCLSKGLSAPIGSLIIGTKQFIHKAKKIRKALGGGMRQAGIIASAGIYSFNHMVDRLEEDHESAQILAKKLSNIKNLFVDLNLVKTNIIFIYLEHNKLSDEEFLFQLKENNIKIDYKGNRKFRLVTHHDFKKNEINTVVSTISNILKG